MGRTRKCAWRNTEAPTQKLKQTQKPQRRPSHFLLYDDGDEELLVQSRGPQASEDQTTVEQNVNASQDEDEVQLTNSDVGFDQNSIKKCISPPSAQSLSGFTAYQGYCNRPGSPRNEKRSVIPVLEKVRVDIPQPKPTERKEKEKSGIGYNMGRTKERAWKSTDTHTQKKLKPTQKISYIECAWRNNANTHIPKKQEPMLELLDDDVEELDPKQKHCELVEVSSMSDSLPDDDNDDVELLTSKQEHCELVENTSPMSDSVEKLSSCQSDIVCIQGYKVKRSIAKTLEAIFKKHGDIAANCVFKSSSMITHFLEVVCELVRWIQTNDMTEMVEDIECLVSDAEAVNINVSWIRSHFAAFNIRKETSNKYSLLLEVKLNTSLVKRAAQEDLRESCEELMSAQERFKNTGRCVRVLHLELMSAQERFKNTERCVRVLHLVEKNLNDNILESKAKLDSWVKHPVV